MTHAIKIGWIGLGKMGTPMSQQLIKAGYPLAVYNRSKEKEDALRAQGASIASPPALLLEVSDIVIIMVSDDNAIRGVFGGEDGLLCAKTRGKIIINMSTVSPVISEEMAAQCRQQGNYYLDAPVSGSVKQAEEGQLVIMAGGEEKVFQQVRSVFEVLGKSAVRVGGTGAGNTAKLAINTLLGIHAQGLAEAILFARKNGVSAEDLMALINNSALGNIFARIKGDAIIHNSYQAAFALKHIAKDLRLARDKGLDTPLGQTVYETFQQAEASFGEEDIIAIIKQVGLH